MKRFSAIVIAFTCIASILGAQNKEGFTTHVVKWYESLQDIAVKYDVPVDVIVEVNNLREPIVNNRQKILIPTSKEYWPSASKQEENAVETIAQDDTVEQQDSIAVAAPSDVISLGLMLTTENCGQNMQNNSLDFYSGVLMAVKKVADKGMRITLDVVQTGDEWEHESLRNDDIIIGPFRYGDFANTLRNDANVSGKILVSPLDPRTAHLAAEYVDMVQAVPSQTDQMESVFSFTKGDNYIVIYSEDDDKSFADVKRVLDANEISYSSCMCSVQGEIEGWAEAYREDMNNKVILATNSEAPLNNAIRNMCIEESKGNITVYAGSKAATYESIPVENIHRAHLLTMATYYVDYSDPATLDFIHKYRALYNSEPSQYAFQGYDLTSFLLETYRKYGKGWAGAITDEEQMDMLQCSFKLKRMENGGLVNTAARKVEYTKDYSIILVR